MRNLATCSSAFSPEIRRDEASNCSTNRESTASVGVKPSSRMMRPLNFLVICCLVHGFNSVRVLKNYINGRCHQQFSSSAFLPVECPATATVIALAPLSERKDLDEAVSVAQAAFPAWAGMSIKARAAIMFRFHTLLDHHAGELSAMIVSENGKNIVEAKAEIAKGAETVEWACSLPQLAQGCTLEVSAGVSCMEKRKALGVVAAIVPFNFPVMVPLWTIPISLVMGNCVIMKPSEKVPSAVNRLAELLTVAGLPKGVFQVVHGDATIAQEMCDHPGIAALTFVGSSAVAKQIVERSQRTGKRVLALGGTVKRSNLICSCYVCVFSVGACVCVCVCVHAYVYSPLSLLPLFSFLLLTFSRLFLNTVIRKY